MRCIRVGLHLQRPWPFTGDITWLDRPRRNPDVQGAHWPPRRAFSFRRGHRRRFAAGRSERLFGQRLRHADRKRSRFTAAVQQPLSHPQGFADLVTKVKPAVFRCASTFPASAEPALTQQMGDDDEQVQIPVAARLAAGKIFSAIRRSVRPPIRPERAAEPIAEQSDHHRRRLGLLHFAPTAMR